MVLQIAICDDLQECLEALKQNTLRYFKEKEPELSYELDVYSHPDELLKACEKKKYHLFLLDIIMPMVNGIRAAKEIQTENPTAFFVFCTSSREYPIEAYTVNAIHYLTKPVNYTEFETALNRFMIRLNGRNSKYIRFKDSSGLAWDCPVREFSYADVSGNFSMVHRLSGEEHLVRISLKQLSEEMKDYPMLVRMGASYLLNLTAIRKIDGNAVILKNKERLYIPRGIGAEIRKQFVGYYS